MKHFYLLFFISFFNLGVSAQSSKPVIHDIAGITVKISMYETALRSAKTRLKEKQEIQIKVDELKRQRAEMHRQLGNIKQAEMELALIEKERVVQPFPSKSKIISKLRPYHGIPYYSLTNAQKIEQLDWDYTHHKIAKPNYDAEKSRLSAIETTKTSIKK